MVESIAQLERQRSDIAKRLRKQQKLIAGIRRRIEAKKREVAKLEQTLAAVLGEAPKAAPVAKRAVRRASARGKLPRQKDLIVQILAEGAKPMSLQEIVDAMQARGYKWLSKSPKDSVGVLMYTNGRTFKKAKPGYFILAKPASAAKPAVGAKPAAAAKPAKPAATK